MKRFFQTQAGITMVELLIGMAITAAVILLSASQFQTISAFFMANEAESAAQNDAILAESLFKNYFRSRWQGGLFNCADTMRPNQDSYCVVPAQCVSTAGNGYEACRSIGIVRGDPLDATTNPDRVRIISKCEVAKANSMKDMTFDGSVCGLTCPKGQFPSVTVERTTLSGGRSQVSFPGGSSTENGAAGRALTSAAEVKGAELCITKPNGSGIVEVRVQTYYVGSNGLNRFSRVSSVPEIVSSNNNIFFLP